MSATPGSTGVAAVLGAFILQRQAFRGQRRETLANEVGCAHAGNTFLNGLTDTFA